MSNRGCRAPGGIRCREGPGRLSGLLTRNKLALENVIQVDLSCSRKLAIHRSLLPTGRRRRADGRGVSLAGS